MIAYAKINLYTKERRQTERVDSRCPLRYQFKGQPNFYETVTRDISEGGLRFITNQFIPAFAELFLEFSLRSSMEPVQAAAKVSWVQKVPHSDQYQVGAHFTELNQEYRKNISDCLSQSK
jgi:Tfp pilus assembly protein PilZ